MAINLSCVLQVRLVAELDEVLAASPHANRFRHEPAVELEAIPCQSGPVIKIKLLLGEGLDECTREQRVFERDLASGARAEDVNGSSIGEGHSTHGAEVRERRHKDSLSRGCVQQGPRAVGGCEDDPRTLAQGGRVFGWGIAQVESRDGSATTLTPPQHALATKLLRQDPRLVRLGDGINGLGPCRQRVNDRRARA